MRDQWVTFRSASTIKKRVRELIERSGLTGLRSFNLVRLIEDVLVPRLPGGLIIRVFDQKEGEPPAHVSYEPTTLHVDREIWRDAKIGEPIARYILAHEIGHLVLHSHAELSFSVGKEDQSRAPDNEQSAEWQANVFAHFLLVPDEVLIDARSLLETSAEISVPQYVITTVQTYDQKRDIFTFVGLPTYGGDPCDGCGNFTLQREGVNFKCTTCGSVTGW